PAIVEAMGTAPAEHRAGALVELQAHVAGYVALRLLKKALQGAAQITEPEAHVHKLGIAPAQAILELDELLALHEIFQIEMRREENGRGRHFVKLAALDSEEAVFHHVAPANGVLASQAIELAHEREQLHGRIIQPR